MDTDVRLRDKAGAWVDLALTLPVFLAYHTGVVFLDVRNATDVVTGLLLRLAEGNRPMYLLITAGIGVVFAGVFSALARGEAFRTSKFVQIMLEGALYAFVMGSATTHLMGAIFAAAAPMQEQPMWVAVVMSLGAGFYEELAFRVVLFALVGRALVWLLSPAPPPGMVETKALTVRAFAIWFGWAVLSSLVFSAIHYIGAYADPFKLTTFTFRFILGTLLTIIFVTRGFAAAVWTHALYDIWVLAFR